MYCPNCGKENNDNAKFCNNCGNNLSSMGSMFPNELSKDGMSALQQDFLNRMDQEMMKCFLNNEDIDKNEIYRKAKHYDLEFGQIDARCLEFDNKIKKISDYVIELYENTNDYVIDDDKENEIIQFETALNIDEDIAWDVLEKCIEKEGIDCKRDLVETLLSSYVSSGKLNRDILSENNVLTKDLQESIFHRLDESLHKLKECLDQEYKKAVDYELSEEQLKRIINEGLSLSFSEVNIHRVVEGYKRFEGINKNREELLKNRAEKAFQDAIIKKFGTKEYRLLDETIVFDGKYFIESYIREQFKNIAEEQSKDFEKFKEASFPETLFIAEYLDRYYTRMTSVINRIETELSVKFDERLSERIIEFLGYQTADVVAAHEMLVDLGKRFTEQMEENRNKKNFRTRQVVTFGGNLENKINNAVRAVAHNVESELFHSANRLMGSITNGIEAITTKKKILAYFDRLPEKLQNYSEKVANYVVKQIKKSYPEHIICRDEMKNKNSYNVFSGKTIVEQRKWIAELIKENPFNIKCYYKALDVFEDQETIQTMIEIGGVFGVDLENELMLYVDSRLKGASLSSDNVIHILKVVHSINANNSKSVGEYEQKIFGYLLQRFNNIYNNNQKNLLFILETWKAEFPENTYTEQYKSVVLRELKLVEELLDQDELDKIEGRLIRIINVKELFSLTEIERLNRIIDNYLEKYCLTLFNDVEEIVHDSVKSIYEAVINLGSKLECESIVGNLFEKSFRTFINKKLLDATEMSDYTKVKSLALQAKNQCDFELEQELAKIDYHIQKMFDENRTIYDYKVTGRNGSNKGNLEKTIYRVCDNPVSAKTDKDNMEKVVALFENCNFSLYFQVQQTLPQIRSLVEGKEYGQDILKAFEERMQEIEQEKVKDIKDGKRPKKKGRNPLGCMGYILALILFYVVLSMIGGDDSKKQNSNEVNDIIEVVTYDDYYEWSSGGYVEEADVTMCLVPDYYTEEDNMAKMLFAAYENDQYSPINESVGYLMMPDGSSMSEWEFLKEHLDNSISNELLAVYGNVEYVGESDIDNLPVFYLTYVKSTELVPDYLTE